MDYHTALSTLHAFKTDSSANVSHVQADLRWKAPRCTMYVLSRGCSGSMSQT